MKLPKGECDVFFCDEYSGGAKAGSPDAAASVKVGGRSTSLLERVNRQLRRKFRQALSFASLKGAEAALYLQVQRLHARWADESWWQASHALYFDLDQTDP
ncbi:MAG TPA: hypothetical protein VN207_08960 [Ktedonobacteraceae bacterium]|nr:hypothetical protein [Ktedonobacteraceae bacterium]